MVASDQELINLMKLGNESAFNAIYDRYWRLIYGHIYKMLKDEDEAKDILQEIFSNLWLKAAQLPPQNNFAGYLYITARHQVLNAIRRHKFKSDYLHSLARYAEQATEDTLQYVDERDLREAIEKEIAALPPRMREVFEMSRKQNLSYKAISERLGTSEDTVKKQMSKSLKIIRFNLNNSGGTALLLLAFLR